MSLRESASHAGEDADLRLVTGLVDGDGGVQHGDFLVRLAQAVARWHWQDVATLREEGVALIGDQPLSDAILVASGFNGITRVADAIGIRLDASTESATEELRSMTKIDDFAPAEKWSGD
jgi:hypothetical protein|tara:strand:+ start:4793 stop:5152 length:360 start_codon:yes stop_codon:yes gene_type:complete